MLEPTELTGESRQALIICPEEARGWKVWIDLSGIVPKLRVEAEVLVANPDIGFQITEGEREDGDDGVTQYLDFSYREGGSPGPIGSWQKVTGPDITAPHPDDSGRYYKSVIIQCDRRAYHQEDDPQPLPEGEDSGAADIERFRDWMAIADFQPGVDPEPLRLRGDYLLNRRSGSVRLQERQPPGINPVELTVDLVIDGNGLGGYWVPAEGRFRAQEGQYKTVKVIDPSGRQVVVEVQEVH